MGCVNRNSKEFKILADHYNLSIGQLELITHKYWIEKGTEEYFPSDVYIQAQLGKVPYKETGESVRTLWKEQYSSPKEYASLEEVQRAMEEAKQYFPASALVFYKNAQDKYVLVVRKPVKSSTVSIEDILDRDNFTDQEKTDFDLLANSGVLTTSDTNSLANIQKEMQAIKEKAIADGTFMKAPNGKPTNLTERQWLQVRTKNFINWFGDWINDPANASKVVDENGEPLVVYHGGAQNITSFKLPNSKVTISYDSTRNLRWAQEEGYIITQEDLNKYNNGEDVEVTKPVGIYFAAHEVVSRSYFGRRNVEDEGLYSTFLNIRNPYVTNKEGKQMHDDSATVKDLQQAKNNNQDGVIIENVRDYGPNDGERMNWETNEFATHPTTDYVVFNPNQIKSATDNIGTFSPENADIMYYKQRVSAERQRAVNVVKQYYSVAAKVSARESLNEAKQIKKGLDGLVFPLETIDSRRALQEAEIKSVMGEIRYKLGPYLSNLYVFTLPNSNTKKIQITLKSEDQVVEDKLSSIDTWSDSQLASEIQRLSEESIIDDMYYLNPKKMAEIERQVKSKALVTEEVIDQTLQFLTELENDKELNVYAKQAIEWLKRGSIFLPRDYNRTIAAFREARKMGLDIQQYKNPIDLLMAIAAKETVTPGTKINPNNYGHLSYNTTYTRKDGIKVEVYDVEDSPEGQVDVVNILATAAPKDSKGRPVGSAREGEFWKTSPWCVSTYKYNTETGKATPTPSAMNYWGNYNKAGRKIALVDGVPVAFMSSDSALETWWDFSDSPYHNLDDINLKEPEKFYKRADNNGVEFVTIGNKLYRVEGNDATLLEENLEYKDWSIRIDHEDNTVRIHQRNKAEIRFSKEGIELSPGYLSHIYSIHIGNDSKADVLTFGGSSILSTGVYGTSELGKIQNEIKAKLQELVSHVEPVSFSGKDKSDPHFLDSLIKTAETINPIYSEIAPLVEELDNKIKAEKAKRREEYRKRREELRRNRNTSTTEFDWSAYDRQDFDRNIAATRNAIRQIPTYTELMEETSEQAEQQQTEPARATARRMLQGRDYQAAYEEQVKKPVNRELSTILRKILREYKFDVRETNAIMDAFGEDALGAFDVFQKIIYLAEEGKRNALVEPEEFSHAFIKMMGTVYRYTEKGRRNRPETKLYSEIRDLLTQTDFFKKVYEEYSSVYTYDNGTADFNKIAEEAMGKALGLVLLERYDKKGKDATFFEKLKTWFEDVILWFKAKFVDSAKLDKRLNDIADSIIDGSYTKKYLNKLDSRGFELRNYDETIEYARQQDGGRALNIIQNLSDIGGVITGSLALRKQGTIYRKGADNLHDIDVVFYSTQLYRANPDIINIKNNISEEALMEAVNNDSNIIRIKEQLPNARIFSNFRARDAEGHTQVVTSFVESSNVELRDKFLNMKGTLPQRMKQLTAEEKQQLYIIDVFSNATPRRDMLLSDNGPTMTHYAIPFAEKLKMGRAKDLFDYQMWEPNNRRYATEGNPANSRVLYSLKPGNQQQQNNLEQNKETVQKSAPTTQAEIVNKKVRTLDGLTSQINTLYDSNMLTASEVTHVAELVMNDVSDMVTKLQTEEGLAQTWFPSLQTEKDFLKATRREIIETVGLSRLLDRAKQLFDSKNVDYDDIETELQADLITENWDAIVSLGNKVFALNEGFGVKMNYDKGSFEFANGMNLGTDEVFSQQDIDSIRELVGDEQEHWQIEERTRDILLTATELVRMALHNCYEIGEDGEPVVSKWGIKERVNPRKAVTSILSWTKGATSLPDMVSKLTEKSKQNKWLNSLIERLNDQSGKEADFQSQFYGVMKRSWQSYSIVVLENGKYKVMAINDNPASSNIIRSVTAQYNIGEHPLFIDKDGKRRIDPEKLGSEATKESKDFNLHKAVFELEDIKKKLDKGEDLSAEMLEKAQRNLSGALKTLGIIPDEAILESILNKENIQHMTKYLGFIVGSLDAALKKQGQNTAYEPFGYRTENNIAGSLRNFIEPLAEAMSEVMPNVVYDDGKLYQSYVTPSYITLLMEKFSLPDAEFNKFIDEEYGKSQWFKTRNLGWRSDWLRRLATNPEMRKIFAHKVELNFNKHRYMRTMSDAEYTISLFAHYWATEDSENKAPTAWFRMPMQSNKPSSEFIRFYAYKDKATYKKNIVDGLFDMYLQEVDRIKTVTMRAKDKKDPGFIKNWDTLGKKFNFLPFLNDYLDGGDSSKRTAIRNSDGTVSENNEKLAKLLTALVKGEKVENLSDLNTYVKEAIRGFNEQKTASILDGWKKQGIFEAAKGIEGIGKTETEIRESLENFVWNDHFAALNILQMTIGDIAAYKDAEDLQKRLAQLHAPGTRANIHATDYNGKEVSDGKYRTIVLEDYEYVSNIIDNLTEVFDRKIERAPESEKQVWRDLKETLVGKEGKYRKINVTDAQGYSSPSSYRKKALMFGRWSRKAEEVYNKLKNGEYNYSDLEVAFQPLKPFVYAQLHKEVGVDGSPIQNMPIPFQAKNAEYLLIMADAMIKGEEAIGGKLSRPNLLGAIYDIMEESEMLKPGKGIDTVQFESAIKSGLQGKNNVGQWIFTEGGREALHTYLQDRIYKKDAEGNLTKEYDTQNYVQETSYDSYCLQQDVPEHFKNHDQAQGSQERMIIPSDLDYYKNPNGDRNAEDNQVWYEWTDPDGTKRKVRANELRREYEETIADNIDLSIAELMELLKLDSNSLEEQNLALSEILQKEILDSSRYGTDMLLACSIDPETGKFRIPKGDPMQSKRIEQLINSIIKSRVNKQEIAGGPIVQVSNFGTSKQLQIRFQDKDGNLLKTQKEWLEEGGTEESFKKYLKEHQAGIAYFEVYAPIWAKEIFTEFADKDGNIDVDAIELVDPELLKMISYRIPTEDKYSIAPMKVVGFMPREAGDAIMFPYELTGIDDSDFDVDKRYVMRKELYLEKRHELPKVDDLENLTDAQKEYIQHNRKSIVDHLIKEVNLDSRVKISAEEIEAIEKEVRFKRHRGHENKLDEIDKRNEQVSNAIDNADLRYSEEKNEKLRDEYTNAPERKYRKLIAAENTRYENAVEDEVAEKVEKLRKIKARDRIYKFLNEDVFLPTKQDDALTREIRKAYLNYVYHVVHPTTGRIANNNKIIDMTWAVLTNEMTADKILNPGGFDNYSRIAYTITAFKQQGIPWKDLEKKTLDDLEALSHVDKDLSWADTQIQFYKQNSAAASLIGVFAVNKVAHAVLEHNGFQLLVTDITKGEKPFKIMDTPFSGLMEVDPTYDKKGTLIGKTLGSGVSASADAVKKPVLNLININMATAGMFLTLQRLGMPVEDASIFMAQTVISDVIDEFNRENLTGYASLNSIIEKRIAKFKKDNTITEASQINEQTLTRDELIEGLTLKSHPVVDYKVLLAFQKIKYLSDAMRKITFATRFNSISSAVGPLIIDNLILEHKIEEFTGDKTRFYTAAGEPADFYTILDRHPVLRAFAETVDIAKQIFHDMPAGSDGFRKLLYRIPSGIADKIWNDKKLLNDLSTFYQSYLMISSGLVDEKKLKYYIDEFPKEFFKKDAQGKTIKDRYPDNELIQNLNPVSSKRTGRTFLQINLTGEDEARKDEYRSAWIDLQKDNPELSKKLVDYFFFRAGIGFSPKTGMALVPTYVKERLHNGDVYYTDVFRKLETPDDVDLIIEQFVLNNWNINKLVPRKGREGTQYKIDYEKGELLVDVKEDIEDLEGVVYMKTFNPNNRQTYLWKLLGDERDEENKGRRVYTRVMPLGDNNEYLEISTKAVEAPMTDTKLDIEDSETSDIPATSPQEADGNTDGKAPAVNPSDLIKNTAEFANLIMQRWSSLGSSMTLEGATELTTKAQADPEQYGTLIQNIYKEKGLDLNKEEAIREFKKLC